MLTRAVELAQTGEDALAEHHAFQGGDVRPGPGGRRLSGFQASQPLDDPEWSAIRIQTVPVGLGLGAVSAIESGQSSHEQFPLGQRRAAGDLPHKLQSLGIISGLQSFQGLPHPRGFEGNLRGIGLRTIGMQHRLVGRDFRQAALRLG